jgi:hypothetical protein
MVKLSTSETVCIHPAAVTKLFRLVVNYQRFQAFSSPFNRRSNMFQEVLLQISNLFETGTQPGTDISALLLLNGAPAAKLQFEPGLSGLPRPYEKCGKYNFCTFICVAAR